MLHHAISSHVLQGHRTGTFCLPHGCTCTTGPQEGHLTKPLCKQCGTREPLCQQTHLLHDKLIQQSALICMAVATAELWGTATQLWGCAPFTPSAKLQLPRSHTLSLRRWRWPGIISLHQRFSTCHLQTTLVNSTKGNCKKQPLATGNIQLHWRLSGIQTQLETALHGDQKYSRDLASDPSTVRKTVFTGED